MKILIVDDSKTMRMILKRGLTTALKGRDVTFMEAENGQEGLDILKENTDTDYVFLDVNMPIMNGDKMLYIMRNSPDLLHIKVVMQTTEGTGKMVKMLTGLGVSGYLLKPFTLEKVQALMDKLLAEEKVPA